MIPKCIRFHTPVSRLSLAVLFSSALAPAAAWAIPSPELVIGSVSSLSQVLAVGVAMVSGLGAVVAAKLGLQPKGKAEAKRYPIKLITGLVLAALALAMLNYWQFTTQRAAEQARLQATLVRPAQFDGTKIKDAALKETSFSRQSDHPLAMSTADAAAALDDGQTLFYDIRETGENAMGTLPGATHIRFPDFLQSRPVQPGQKVVLFCHNGNRSSETCAKLAAMGIDCSFIAGGIEKWIVEGRDFSDTDVKTLSDLRAIPEYPGRNVLLSTADFTGLMNTEDLQIVDTRYPGDFDAGHLPGAVNIPIRKMTTADLMQRISELDPSKPTLAACYDRRSCFMSQVLGLELAQKGFDFRGRYTLPWEYFIAPAPKPHVQAWLADQQSGLWDKAISALAAALLWVHERSHILLGLLALSLITRIMILPVALKSERDQITTNDTADEMKALKERLADDPVRKARAVQAFYADKGLTPMKNLTALLFLPVMMLGVSAAQVASASLQTPFLWMANLGAADPLFIMPVLFCALAAVYLLWAVAKTPRQKTLWMVLGMPALFAMVFTLTAAANAYLCFSLTLLLVQRAYVTGMHKQLGEAFALRAHKRRLAKLPRGVIPMGYTEELEHAGNKALRLSILRNAGLPVPGGVIVRSDAIHDYREMSDAQKNAFAAKVFALAGGKPVAVRSSASNEDGADQSFAGVFESVLDVTADTMRAALDDVVESFSSDRAASYAGDGDSADQGNIVVQEMVQADYAGVMFTQDPMAPGMCMIEWVEGCGEDLVSGRVTPTSLRFGRYTGLPASQDQDRTLDMAPLLALGQQIEETFGAPQDVEWAYANGQFQIVQSRDITTLSLGTEQEQARLAEWRDLLDHYGDADPDQTILEQDEMSEVLPRPTPLSFSLMGSLWSPGGSVDLACRALSVPYNLPEGRAGHLVNLFGKTYVDVDLKEQMTLKLTATKAKQLRKQARPMIDRFHAEVLPRLSDQLAFWQAVDYAALPLPKQLEAIATLRDLFVTDIYVEAEKVNIIAGFTMGEASAAAAGDPALRAHLMHADLPNAPSSLLASCTGPMAESRAQVLMGHRSIFDYELSAPRYKEAPSLLISLLDSSVEPISGTVKPPADLPEDLRDTLDLAIAYQDLKEQAKHEALRVLAELRRALLALGSRSGLDDLVFYLDMDDIMTGNWDQPEALKDRATARKHREELRKPSAPTSVNLTLRDCELLSLGAQAGSGDGSLGGTCVAGSGRAEGRVFWVEDETAIGPDVFDGFQEGDILACRMINPAWLPYVQRSGAVLSEVGGWLSHMAIVAREKDILMLVACKGLDQLAHGELITVAEDGSITQSNASDLKAASA
ncbi:PEP/pyruvate-binding domain-containing protein [Phaeobacter inhibens]|uniref:PEP/pyruvate-binding domain-containing protein n=1 Tax=Phaeobacter inhibens TaxID=221822 RepID=UPI0021A70C6E|nr:PEP/pyruvate-binding domain-containing protein [Phaeobacter inhibens]UWR58822.1 YidC/Oxa1 family membrane protein insertase [Phaeobacter inhibens]